MPTQAGEREHDTDAGGRVGGLGQHEPEQADADEVRDQADHVGRAEHDRQASHRRAEQQCHGQQCVGAADELVGLERTACA